MGSSSSDFESGILAEELERVLVEDLVDEGGVWRVSGIYIE